MVTITKKKTNLVMLSSIIFPIISYLLLVKC